jgi:hypothetical protein
MGRSSLWRIRKIFFTTVTHLVNRKVNGVWAAMHQIYQMYMLRGFHILEIAGDGEFVLGSQIKWHPSLPILRWIWLQLMNMSVWSNETYVFLKRKFVLSVILCHSSGSLLLCWFGWCCTPSHLWIAFLGKVGYNITLRVPLWRSTVAYESIATEIWKLLPSCRGCDPLQ